MDQLISVRCPTCGNFANRTLKIQSIASLSAQPQRLQITRTECPHCDYLMTVCLNKSAVCSVYAPAIAPQRLGAIPYTLNNFSRSLPLNK